MLRLGKGRMNVSHFETGFYASLTLLLAHYEWQISFPPYDVDLSKVQAKFDPDGRLTIRVPRRLRMMGR